MRKPSQQRQSIEEAPLYIRWKPDRAPYAVELKLELVTQIASELDKAEKLGIEIGGMLLGTLPQGPAPILRIEGVALIARRFEDGAIYVLEPGQQQRFAEIRASARLQGRVPVGFFRSHLRPGPLQPSLADRTLLTEQFAQGTYALLLINSRPPRPAAFFLTANGQLPDQPSARSFYFDNEEFKFLPEVPGDALAGQAMAHPAETVRQPHRWVAWISMVMLLTLLAIGIFSNDLARLVRPPANKLDLKATPIGNVLKISWDHNAGFMRKARGAILRISDGTSQQEVHLGPDELRLGEVDYEHSTKQIEITMTLDLPGSPQLPPQTLSWKDQ